MAGTPARHWPPSRHLASCRHRLTAAGFAAGWQALDGRPVSTAGPEGQHPLRRRVARPQGDRSSIGAPIAFETAEMHGPLPIAPIPRLVGLAWRPVAGG